MKRRVIFWCACVLVGWPGWLPISLWGADQTNQIPDWRSIDFIAEASKEKIAQEPWKQIVVIRSKDEGRPENRNVIGFLDDHRLLVADADHPIRVFDADTGALLKSFGEPARSKSALVVSPGGRWIIILPDHAPKIWDTHTGECVAVLPAASNYLHAVFYPNQTRLATYVGTWPPRTPVTNNLIVWEFTGKNAEVSLLHAVGTDRDVRGLHLIGPYLLAQSYRHCTVLDAATLTPILTQPPRETDEEFLFLTPPTGIESGRFASLEYRPGKGSASWKQTQPALKVVGLPAGNELRRWPCPIEEALPNDHRYQAHYFMSPQHTVLAISQKGRVNFFRFEAGTKLSTVPAASGFDHPMLEFLNEDVALVTCSTLGGAMRVVDVRTGQPLASIPYSEFPPAVSPDRRHLAIRRNSYPLPGGDPVGGGGFAVQLGLIALWKQTGE